MTPSLTTNPPLVRRRGQERAASSTRRRARRRCGPAPHPRRVLERYVDCNGCIREVFTRAGADGSVLVVDRDARTQGDRRLVAHLGADEPPGNAALMSRLYIDDEQRERCPCRPLTANDARIAPFVEEEAASANGSGLDAEPTDRQGQRYRLEPVQTGMSIPELRWRRHDSELAAEHGRLVSLRDAVARLESYEPVRSLTQRALVRHRGDPDISTTVLRAELRRVQDSPILLNRRLREVVLERVDRERLSMSEIAIRCGRVKRDRRGKESGETSWLARRLGLLPEAGQRTPTPWIHSDVLALIARSGLGVSPHEVEVG
jgi:hypothetical protein